MSDFEALPIDPAAAWPDVPKLSTSALLRGGDGGALNAQAVALTARANLLQQQQDGASDAAIAAATARVDAVAVSKESASDQLMSGNLVVRKNDGAVGVHRADEAGKTLVLYAPSGNAAKLLTGPGYTYLYVPGNVVFDTLSSLNIEAKGPFTVLSGATQTIAAGAVLNVAAGATLTLAALPVNPTDAANKQYVDGPRASALVLPGNAVNPLEAVPLQQLGAVGTWSPAVSVATGLVNVTAAVGRYEKTGRVVRLFARLRITNTSGSNAFISTIGGLPFPISSELGSTQVWGGGISYAISNLAGTTNDGTGVRDAYIASPNHLGVGVFNSVTSAGVNTQVSTSTTQELWINGLTYLTP